MPDTISDPVAARLAGARDRMLTVATGTGTASEIEAAVKDGWVLLAAVQAVLELHKPQPEIMRTVCARHAAPAEVNRAWRDAVDACPACTKREHTVCSHCQCPNDDWPCPTYRAAVAELEALDG